MASALPRALELTASPTTWLPRLHAQIPAITSKVASGTGIYWGTTSLIKGISPISISSSASSISSSIGPSTGCHSCYTCSTSWPRANQDCSSSWSALAMHSPGTTCSAYYACQALHNLGTSSLACHPGTAQTWRWWARNYWYHAGLHPASTYRQVRKLVSRSQGQLGIQGESKARTPGLPKDDN